MHIPTVFIFACMGCPERLELYEFGLKSGFSYLTCHVVVGIKYWPQTEMTLQYYR